MSQPNIRDVANSILGSVFDVWARAQEEGATLDRAFEWAARMLRAKVEFLERQHGEELTRLAMQIVVGELKKLAAKTRGLLQKKEEEKEE